MRNRTVFAYLLFISLTNSCFAQKAKPGVATRGQNQPGSELFLTDADIAHAKQIMPALADASQLGPKEAAAYLATLDVSFDQLTQILSNISVAYTAIRFDEWSTEITPKLNVAKSPAYKQSLDQSRQQLDQITAKYKAATDGGKSALDVNEAMVRKNLADVEAILVRMKGAKTASLPFHP
jgi:hypothetical protein